MTHENLTTVISATDLVTGNAVRFGSERSSCSPLGKIVEDVPVCDAVAASAAFPVLLPQLVRTYTFAQRDGSETIRSMSMTDGGVYDNLGLTPLLPGRSRRYTDHVYELDYLIAIDAGAGRMESRSPRFMLSRLKRSFEIAHTRNQDGSRSRIHELAGAGLMDGMIYSYLGMNDERLPTPVSGLVTRNAVASYPTNFAKMPLDAQTAITERAEQLTRTLVDYYCPELGR